MNIMDIFTVYIYLVQRLEMLGAIPPVPPYIFMVWCFK